MSEAWRHELRLAGIDLFALQPGAYDTDIWTRNRHVGRRARDADDPWAAHVAKVDARFAAIVDARKADPEAYGRYLVRLVERPPRRFRHPMGPGAHLRSALLRLAPFSWIESVVHRLLLR
jgi:NAD(P)-dependent dehydrogenase (short-subunit alcohol dehydrogenase family)